MGKLVCANVVEHGMPGRRLNAAEGAQRAGEIARDLRAYADSGMDPAFAAKLLAAAAELEARLALTAGEPVAA
jgi:hypothetical protein